MKYVPASVRLGSSSRIENAATRRDDEGQREPEQRRAGAGRSDT